MTRRELRASEYLLPRCMQLLVSAPTLWSCLHDADLMSCVDAGTQRLLLCMLRRLCCSSTSERKEDFSAAVRACLSQSLRCVHCSNAAAPRQVLPRLPPACHRLGRVVFHPQEGAAPQCRRPWKCMHARGSDLRKTFSFSAAAPHSSN